MNNVILEQIDLERRDETIEHYNIKSCINMLESLYESTAEREDQRLYVTSFEEEFLQASREFYREEAQLLLKESDAGAYCRHTWKRITQEQERCQTTLSTTSQQRIEKVLEEELILNRIRDLIEMDTGVKFMVDNERLQDLSLIFELNKRVDSKTTELTRAMHKIIVAMGTEINNSAIAASQATAGPGKDDAAEEGEEKPEEKSKEKVAPGNQQTTAAIKWVDDVLALKDKFDSIWTNAFSEDQPLQTCITRSFTDFINSSSFPRSSEYISLFIDDNMKKGIKGKTENEIDVVLDKAITLLRYVQDKDLFERYYKKHLCRRLLMKKSISDEVEKQMVSKMKMELGNQFTSKLEAMFKDVTVSRDLTANYKSFVEQLGEKDAARVELSIEVLTSMTWPLESMGSAGDDEESRSKLKCIFPSSIEHIKSSFEKFYSEKHSGRTLTWLPNMGSADIKAVFPKVPNKGERRHELNVSTYAMCILMLFNDLPESASLTFEEIQAQTNIPNADLIRNVQSLAVAPKTRILIKSPMSKDVKPTDRFSFNPSFQGRSHRIQIGVVKSGNKVEGTKERLETEKKNNDSRGFCIEAAVVRIMKYVLPLRCTQAKRYTNLICRQRKELPHANLITESISQLSSQFKPDISMIKKRIESLIEREYLERIESAPVPSYRYLA